MNDEQLVAQLKEHGVRIVEFLYTDYTGLLRGKTVLIDHLTKHLHAGMGITKAMFASTARDGLVDVEDMTAVGELRLVPDLDSLHILPWAPVATMMCDHYNTDHTKAPADPRNILQQVVADLKAAGFTAQMTYEHEFELFTDGPDGRQPANPKVCFSTEAMDFGYTFLPELLDQLQALGIEPVEYYPEAGAGQHELPQAPAAPLAAADHMLNLKRVVKHVALTHDLYATFAPKPMLDSGANGAHIHFSLWDEAGKNAFYDADADMHLSAVGRHFIGGMLAHIQGLLALTCASVNSYQRLQPGHWSSAYATFGQDNREAAIRVPSSFWGDAANGANVELKASDATANPYMALAGILAAGLDGIRRELEPTTPVDVDPAQLSAERREELGVHRLPTNLQEALDALAADPLFTQVFSARTIDAYVKVKHAEVTHFANMAPEAIAAEHRDLY
ncbi:glutamine synthetase family protein [Lacticaseibacillus jixiensis]|uniref:glutamine synthetase family protein n=1 Tax=Lacticaseibacillus jixiensis TaxID=3231926 RepID=UPI0036F20CAA